MKILGAVLIIAAAVYLIVLMVGFYRQGKFLRAMLITAASGIAAFTAFELLSGVTGVRLPVNGWTVGTSAALGVPGIAAMLLIRIFF